MADRTAVVEKVREIAERVGASEGVEVVDVQLLGGGNSRVLRIFIDKPQGVTHADCEFMSHNAGAILDVEDVIPGGHYTLEVSSPDGNVVATFDLKDVGDAKSCPVCQIAYKGRPVIADSRLGLDLQDTSLSAVMASPRTCSGLAYSGVIRCRPVRVI